MTKVMKRLAKTDAPPVNKFYTQCSNRILSMTEEVPDDIRKDLEKACILHERAVSDYTLCMEFSKLMSDVLARLEDAKCWDATDKVMSILLDCNPKIGAHCDKSTIVGKATKKALQPRPQKTKVIQ